MSRTALAKVFISLLLTSSAMYPATLDAQTATVIESTTRSLSYTFDNASGFSITNNGTMIYDGPLNQLTGSPCCSSATLVVNGEAVQITADNYENDTGLKANHEGGMTLSSRLEESRIPVNSELDQVGLQYLVITGGTTRIKTSDSYAIQEKVDSQSLSIFPQFQPSVFP